MLAVKKTLNAESAEDAESKRSGLRPEQNMAVFF